METGNKISDIGKNNYPENDLDLGEQHYMQNFTRSHNSHENDTILLAEDLIDDCDLMEKYRKVNLSTDEISNPSYSSLVSSAYRPRKFSGLKPGYTGYYDGYWKAKYMSK